MKPNLMSMAQLDKIVRDPIFNEHIRRSCLAELKAREGQLFGEVLTLSTCRGNRNGQYVAPGL